MPDAVRSVAVGMTEPSSGTSEQRPRLPFRPDIQGLRALAVVLVIAFHSGIAQRGGFLGVDVFFVISGFVIGRLLLDEHRTSGRVSLESFYARRIRRLVPALALVLVFVAVVSIVATGPLGSVREITKNTGIGAAVYVANIAILRYQDVGYFDLGATNNPLLHTWTLGVEEQFYLFFPVLLIVLGSIARRARGRRVIAVGIGVVAVFSFLVGAAMTDSLSHGFGPFEAHGRFAFYASPTRAWEFLVGVLVAVVEPRVRVMRGAYANAWAIIGVTMILGAAWMVTGTDSTPGLTTLVPVAGAALAIVAGIGGSSASERILGSRPLTWIGDRSYGWYLWHWPLMVFVRISFPTVSNWVILLVGVAALVPTELSYRYVEQPIRHNHAWLGWRAVATGVACLAVAVLALVSLVTWVPSPRAQAASLQAVFESTVRAPNLCYSTGDPDDPNAKDACIWRAPDAQGKVVVIGDSLAWALNDAMVVGATRAGYDENLIFRPGCPFADVLRQVDGLRERRACRDFVTTKTEAILRTRPALVVLVSNQDSYVASDRFALKDPVTGRVGRDATSRAAIWEAGLGRTLRAFTDEGIPTIVVASVPQLDPFDLELCPAWRLWTDPLGCRRTLSRRWVDRNQALGRQATIDAVQQSGTLARYVDFEDDLCTGDECSTYHRGRWTYRDQTHVSTAGARLLVPRVERDVISFARSRRDS